MTDLGDGLTLTTHAGEGYRMVMRENINICHDGPVEVKRNQSWCDEMGDVGKSIAWIGGGLCIGPSRHDATLQTVYEIEPALAQFCPEGVVFVPGDWRDTIIGQFDVIVYDLGGLVPRGSLSKHLAPGGTILPKEDD